MSVPVRVSTRWEPRGRSLRAMVIGSALAVVLGIAGAALRGPTGTMIGAAVASWIGALLFWGQFRTALRESRGLPDGTPAGQERPTEHHQLSRS